MTPNAIDIEGRRRAETSRYTRRNILRSEYMYGRGFQSPGGIEALEGFCRRLRLEPGMRALEIGSGLGGSAFYLASRHGLSVLGLDVADAMVALSSERAAEAGIDRVKFVRGDIRSAELAPGSFDLVWTRDCILYLAEKELVWRRAAACLAPGGQLFVSDFARGDGEPSAAFRAYLDGCGYHLQTFGDYARAIESAGLTIVEREDVTAAFQSGLEIERSHLVARRADFLRHFDAADYDYLIERWDRKIAFCRAGELRWALFVARKG